MPDSISLPTSTWMSSVTPTPTSITSINPTNLAGVYATLLIAQARASTETNVASLYHLSRAVRGAAASYTIIRNQRFLATATATQEFPRITEEMVEATQNLKDLEWEANLFGTRLSLVANILFAALFGVCFIIHVALALRSRSKFFGFAMICGTAQQLATYLARTISYCYSWSNPALFLLQMICSILSPAVIMAGVYYLLGQLIVVTGHGSSLFTPIWVTCLFMLLSLMTILIQVSGVIVAAIQFRRIGNTATGRYIILAGIAFQILAMIVFLVFLFDYIYRTFFNTPDRDISFSLRKLFQMLFNTRTGSKIKDRLDRFYSPKFEYLRKRRWFRFTPLILLLATILVLIRCVYRVIELVQGWKGYLFTHQEFFMVLDSVPILLVCVLFIVFHPLFMFGRKATKLLSFETIRKFGDEPEEVPKETSSSYRSSLDQFVFVTKLSASNGIQEYSKNAHGMGLGNHNKG